MAKKQVDPDEYRTKYTKKSYEDDVITQARQERLARVRKYDMNARRPVPLHVKPQAYYGALLKRASHDNEASIEARRHDILSDKDDK